MLTMTFRYSDKKLKKLFKLENFKPKIKYHQFEDHEIRYLELITNPDLPYVVFIHGAPGSSGDYIKFFRNKILLDKANLISVDRLGYGHSDFGIPVPSIRQQGATIQSIVTLACNSKDVILVGHSYGGPIAIRMAMDFPQDFSQVILLAPALDPENEKEINIAQLAIVRPTQWLTPTALRVAAVEKTTHIDELKKMLPWYHRIKVPVCHIHGDQDSLVPYENIAFSESHIASDLLEIITLKKTDHFLPWSHHDLIVQKIVEAIAGLKTNHQKN